MTGYMIEAEPNTNTNGDDTILITTTDLTTGTVLHLNMPTTPEALEAAVNIADHLPNIIINCSDHLDPAT